MSEIKPCCECESCALQDTDDCSYRAALAASQAEGEFYASEAEALRVEVGHLKDSHASRDAELESAESALAELEAVVKAAKEWEDACWKQYGSGEGE